MKSGFFRDRRTTTVKASPPRRAFQIKGQHFECGGQSGGMTNGFWPLRAERRDLARSKWRPSLVDGQKEKTRRIVDTQLEREREAASLIADAVIGFGETGDGGGAKMKFFPAVGTDQQYFRSCFLTVLSSARH